MSAGHRLKGRDVLGAGVATHACDAARIPELERTLLNLNSTYAEDITAVIQDFSKASTFGKDEEFSLKPFASQIQKCFEGGSVEEIVSKLEADGSDWAKKQIDRLNKMSPTSLKITFEALKRGEHSTLPECLSMEYRLAQRCCADHDFYEGVRALLKDRDNSPKWKPDSLDQVTHQVIQKYFSNLPPEDELTF
ncbi:UNVERIFIED_CONTAM: hypothetical protein GTU68_009580 [Idotea baltica]|nr:hypothetical protein [Idotea baltica]